MNHLAVILAHVDLHVQDCVLLGVAVQHAKAIADQVVIKHAELNAVVVLNHVQLLVEMNVLVVAHRAKMIVVARV